MVCVDIERAICAPQLLQRPARLLAKCTHPHSSSQQLAKGRQLTPQLLNFSRDIRRHAGAQTDQATEEGAKVGGAERPDAALTSAPQADRPGTSSAAISAGIAELKAGRPEQAIELFQAALELPGNGAMRFAGTVREYRCASDGEEQAALYNMACAYAALSQRDSALACLEGAFEAGLSDYATVRGDPDLDAVRGPEMDKLLGKYDGLLARIRRKKGDGGFWLGW